MAKPPKNGVRMVVFLTKVDFRSIFTKYLGFWNPRPDALVILRTSINYTWYYEKKYLKNVKKKNITVSHLRKIDAKICHPSN